MRENLGESTAEGPKITASANKHPITLAFRDSDAVLERPFLRHYCEKSLWQVRWCLGLAVALYASFGLLDLRLMKEPAIYHDLWAVRAVVVAVLVALIAFSWSKHFSKWWQPALAAGLVFAGFGINGMIYRVGIEGGHEIAQGTYYAGLILVVMVGYTVVRARFVWASVAGWIIVLGYELVANYPPEHAVDGSILLSNNFFFISANIIGMFACYSIERHARYDYYLNSLLTTKAIELQQMSAQLEKLSVTDELTKVYNRRMFDTKLQNEWDRGRRAREPLSLVMCDVDYFKAFNDTYGHQAGDDCLRKVAQTIEKWIRRPSDLVGRYGGEEFGIILPNTSAEGAAKVANEIRRMIAEQEIPHSGTPLDGRVTVSMGVCCTIPVGEATLEMLVECSDAALYKAKRAGRNQVVVDPFEPVELESPSRSEHSSLD